MRRTSGVAVRILAAPGEVRAMVELENPMFIGKMRCQIKSWHDDHPVKEWMVLGTQKLQMCT